MTVQVPVEDFGDLGLGDSVLTPSRTNGFLNMVEALRVRARRLANPAAGGFPSLRISADALRPQGSFAEAQARFLEPDAARVDALAKVRRGSSCFWSSPLGHAPLRVHGLVASKMASFSDIFSF